MGYSPSTIVVSTLNSSSTPLNNGQTFTGTAELNDAPQVLVVVNTDRSGTYNIQASIDNVNFTTLGSYTYRVGTGSINRPHLFVKGRRYIRVSFTNNSGQNQTYFNLQTSYGVFGLLSLDLNSVIAKDASSIVTRNIDPSLALANSQFEGIRIQVKNGRNPDIDSGTLPEDIWGGNGVYAGFPTGSPEQVRITSTSASDTGTVTFTGLKTSNDTEYTSETVTLNGTTPVVSVNSWYRVHTFRYSSGSSTTMNLGDITIQHNVTTANIFAIMPIGTGQSNCSCLTIPAGKTGYLKRLHGMVMSGTSAAVDCSFWVREFGGSPRLRKPFTLSNTFYNEDINYFISLPEKTDFTIRATATTGNNLIVLAGYDLILVDN